MSKYDSGTNPTRGLTGRRRNKILSGYFLLLRSKRGFDYICPACARGSLVSEPGK